MPSRVEPTDYFAEDRDDVPAFRVRSSIEWLLHAVAVVALGFLIWQALHALRERPAGRASGSAVRAALASWSTREAPHRAHVVFDSVPTADLRDWVAAFPGAGTTMTWEGPALKPSAVAVEPVADPKRPARIWIAAPRGSAAMIRDDNGVIDSVVARGGGAVLTAQNVAGVVSATVGGTSSTAALRDSLTLKPVLLLGVAGWEGKFILASLEEHGWKVDARFSIGSTTKGSAEAGVVTQGPTAPVIDTAHYAAVIVTDTAGAKYAGAIAAYVRSGGGFIATGDAAALPAFAEILPGTTGPATQDADFSVDTAEPRAAYAMLPVGHLKTGAVPVETMRRQTAVAAQRVGQGRVLQVGYLDTWRWRMGGVDDPVEPYRAWWATMLSSVAYAPRTPRAVPGGIDPTPMATLVSTLGQPTRVAVEHASLLNDPRLLPVLFALLMGALFVEWASRRLRGQP